MSVKNILFIMCDQLRYDYLGYAGHPTIKTPNIDALARRGVRFDNTYVQSTICGPSRMSFYTGRYVRSHGATWNNTPLRVGELNIGDHLNPLGMRTALCGKTHMRADVKGLERLGIDMDSEIGAKVAQCGFEVWDRLDGLHPPKGSKRPSHYNKYLNEKGYEGDNPWEDWAASVNDEDDEIVSGWLLKHSDKAQRVAVEDSETAYSTTRAMEFIEDAGDDRWLLHLSYIKPHWPYVAPAPYHDMYGPEDVIPPIRSEAERENPHPVYGAFQQHRVSQVFSRDGVRERVIPAYMGLITQIDDEIGRLTKWLEDTGRIDNTLIVFTADHGDYLGDHWLGEKELFHEQSVRVPLFIVDPSPAADATRGTVSDALVEAIDLLPTFVDYAGGEPRPHILEGHSLRPLIEGRERTLRSHVISEYDYSVRAARLILDQPIPDARLLMIFDGRMKLILAPGFRPMLYDLKDDPQELRDLGESNDMQPVIEGLTAKLFDWATAHHSRVTLSDKQIEKGTGGEFRAGVLIGFWDEAEVDEAELKGVSGN